MLIDVSKMGPWFDIRPLYMATGDLIGSDSWPETNNVESILTKSSDRESQSGWWCNIVTG